MKNSVNTLDKILIQLAFGKIAATGQILTQAPQEAHNDDTASVSFEKLIMVSIPRLAKVKWGLSCCF